MRQQKILRFEEAFFWKQHADQVAESNTTRQQKMMAYRENGEAEVRASCDHVNFVNPALEYLFR